MDESDSAEEVEALEEPRPRQALPPIPRAEDARRAALGLPPQTRAEREEWERREYGFVLGRGEEDQDRRDDEEGAASQVVAEDASGYDWDQLLARLALPDEGWVTLDEAGAAAGISRSTLRAWYRSGRIPSAMVPSAHGPQRVVPLDAVLDRVVESPRLKRQLQRARALEAEVDDLRRRVWELEQGMALLRLRTLEMRSAPQ